MSSFLNPGQKATVTLTAGHTLKFFVFRDAEATVRAVSGLPGAPYLVGLYTDTGETTIGPFSTGCVLTVDAAQQDIEYDSGASPAVTGYGATGGDVAATGPSSALVPPWVSSQGFAADLAAVGSVTIPSAGGTPANEFLLTNGNLTFTDGGGNWGAHQNKIVRMQDGTLFAVCFDATNLLLKRSATGGTYGSAWTTAATITNASRRGCDLDAHLLRNAVTDQVHLIASDSTANAYRIRTYNSAGSLVNDWNVPDQWPGSGAKSTTGWLAIHVSDAMTNYSAAGIGPDGTICLAASVSTDTVEGVTPSEINAIKRWQLLRWNGSSWYASKIYKKQIGPRLTYDRIWVSPPGRPGEVIAFAQVDVKVNDWYNSGWNPNYSAGTWPNAAADSTYFGFGRFPECSVWSVPVDDPSEANFTTEVVLPRNIRTVDITGNAQSYQAYTTWDAHIDGRGRLWVAYGEGDGNTTLLRNLTVYDLVAKAQKYDVQSAGTVTSGFIGPFHEEVTGVMWLGWLNNGNSMDGRLMSTTDTGSSLTVQAYTAAATQAGTGKPWVRNQATDYYHGIEHTCIYPSRRNGSVISSNWFDMLIYAAADHTGGAAPGTTLTASSDGTMRPKRVRVQVPAT
jgi:hypothetical protein